MTIPKHDSVLSQVAPHVADHFGLWAIEPGYLQAAVDRVQGCDLTNHVQLQGAVSRSRFGGPGYAISDGVAVIELTGVLMKAVSSMGSGTSTVETRRQIRSIVQNSFVEKILLLIDSPGGTVAGMTDLADEVARAAKQKPIWAYIEDLGTSAAYGVASRAERIYANRTAHVGGIGTYGVVLDLSKLATSIEGRIL
ncbi:unnamed protein product, partial [marine sediment metagenome]